MPDPHTHQEAPAIEWLHLLPPADSAEMAIGYEAAFPFLQMQAALSATADAAHTPHAAS